MKRIIKKSLMNKPKLYKLATGAKFLMDSSFLRVTGKKKNLPKVVQLPLTYKCNSACVMCNIWQMDHSNEMPVDEFAKYVKDPIFREVTAVGINGGEPTTISNLEDYVKEILKLPNLKYLNMISNGFMVKRLLNKLEVIYQMCKEKNINFHVSLSLDGYNETHNKVRGKDFAFERTISAIREINKNKNSYCDSFDVGCTVIKQNIHNTIELDEFARIEGIQIKYRLGIENKRIESDKLTEQYSLLYDDLRQGAKEFFHSRINKEKEINNKFKYYAIYYYLANENPKRLLGCMWKEDGITVDSRGSLYYCAVASEEIGTLREQSGEDIFFNNDNIEYRKSIVQNNCDNCIHDYAGKAELKNVLVFIKEMLNDRLYTKIYKWKAMIT